MSALVFKLKLPACGTTIFDHVGEDINSVAFKSDREFENFLKVNQVKVIKLF